MEQSSGQHLTEESRLGFPFWAGCASLGDAHWYRRQTQSCRSCPPCRDRGGSEQPAKACLAGADRAAFSQGIGTNEIMRVTGKAKTCVWRWQDRFMLAGVEGLLRDKTRPSRLPPLGTAVAERVVALTLTEPPGETTQWTAAAMATACVVSVSSVHRIWRSHGLRPHQVRQFKLSRDPQFAAIAPWRSDCEAAGGGAAGGVRDIVGLYVVPPAHAVVLSVDEKSQIQALDRTQPSLPLKKGRCGTMPGKPLGLTPHDYKRNGTTTLFAALDVLEGTVIGRCMQRHRHQEFIRFLSVIEAEVPAAKQVHVVLDNYAAHKHPKVVEWLGRHPRFAFQFTPTSASRRKPPVSLGANFRFRRDQRRRGLLCQADQAPPEARRVPLPGGFAGRHQAFRRRGQRQPKALLLDKRPGQDHRCRQTGAPRVRFAPLALLRHINVLISDRDWRRDGQRGKLLTRLAVRRRRIVAMECGTWRSGRMGGATRLDALG